LHYSSELCNNASPVVSNPDVNEQFARIGKALASPRRVQLLDLLGQGERSVEDLARASGMTVTNASQHLQVLRGVRLIDARKEGTKVFHRIADDEVHRFFSAFRDIARTRLAEVEQFMQRCADADEELEPVTRAELLRRAKSLDVVVLDVRPRDEYVAGHIPGAVSIPFEQLEHQLASLPDHAEIVAYCRGPYCLLAPHAVELLRRQGFRARRLEDGLPEWRLAGLPMAVGEEKR